MNNQYKAYYTGGLTLVSITRLFFYSNRAKRRLRVEKPTDTRKPNDLLSSLNLQEENVPLRNNNNHDRNPFYSKSLFTPSTNYNDIKSFPNSPLYSSKFTTSGIKPTTLGFCGQSTGLESDFLANVSLRESTRAGGIHARNHDLGLYALGLNVLLKVLFVFGRFLLAWERIPLQSVMFAANFALSNQTILIKKHIGLLYMFRTICLTRLIWLGLECSSFSKKDLMASIDEKIAVPLVKNILLMALEKFVQFKNQSSFAIDSLIILINN